MTKEYNIKNVKRRVYQPLERIKKRTTKLKE